MDNMGEAEIGANGYNGKKIATGFSIIAIY